VGSLGGVAQAWLPKAIRHAANIQELLDFLNNAPMPDPADVVGLWHLTSVVEQDGEFLVLAGDQVKYIAYTEGEAHAFLAGCAMATSFVLHTYSQGGIDLTT
jgi:hypothetical protein